MPLNWQFFGSLRSKHTCIKTHILEIICDIKGTVFNLQPLRGINSSALPSETLLSPSILASHIRIIPLECSGNCHLRFELIGHLLGMAFLINCLVAFPFIQTIHKKGKQFKKTGNLDSKVHSLTYTCNEIQKL